MNATAMTDRRAELDDLSESVRLCFQSPESGRHHVLF